MENLHEAYIRAKGLTETKDALFDRHLRDIAPECRVMWGLVFLGHVEAAIPLDAEKDGARSQGLVDGIDGSGQALCALVADMVSKERGDMGIFLLDACEDHSAFLVGVSLME